MWNNIIKKLFLVFVISLYIFPTQSYAELWNGREDGDEVVASFFPPYNRKAGRNGCLKQYRFPGPFEMFYNKYCAEESANSTYFSPKIRVRVQTCNVGCWTLSNHLNGDGECTVYPGAFGIPLLRLCARLALPADPEAPSVADHGYTYGWHLNFEGAPETDPVYIDDLGKEVYLARPKVCAYWDPSLWDSLANYASILFGGSFAFAATMLGNLSSNNIDQKIANAFIESTGSNPADERNVGEALLSSIQASWQPDLWDLNPVSQNNHFHAGGIFFLFQLIIQAVKMGVGMADLGRSIIEMIPPEVMWMMHWVKEAWILLWLISVIGEAIIIPVLEYFGQMNNVVAAAIGCVMVPLGPNPPPYCSPMASPPPLPKIQEICPTVILNGSITTLAPTQTQKCVNSKLENNAIHNVVRVGFDESLPLCKKGQEPGDTCVKIFGSTTSSVLHSMTSYTNPTTGRKTYLDIIPVCSTLAPTKGPCVISPTLITKCKADPLWCSKGVRIVYANQAGDVSFPNDYYDSTVQDCDITKNSLCQSVWGVNIGDFVDIATQFPTFESSYKSSPLNSPISLLKDSTVNTLKVKASIVRKDTTLDSLHTIEPEMICVYDVRNSKEMMVGCVPRASMPKPSVYKCGSSPSGTSCVSSNTQPRMVVRAQIGKYATEGPVTVVTNSVSESRINLAGYDYDSFVTDSNYAQKPFSGPRSINPLSIYGIYKDNKAPYDSNGNAIKNVVYLNGLEYYNGKYTRGGRLSCLSGYKFEDCLTGKSNENCVRTSLVNKDFVKCTNFHTNILGKYQGISVCSTLQLKTYKPSATVKLPGALSGTQNISVFKEASSGRYCYTYNGYEANGELCTIGYTSAVRETPSPIFGDILAPNQYYNYTRTASINQDVLAVRNKTAIEQGLCISVPELPKCAAISSSNAPANGNATWLETRSGEIATGQCLPGMSQY
ncbi:MAG UNVERIFIED_CONTAM: hypothetical protein LVR18_03570 [Planctomycetaceae bacterium]|jgi:hypothetical protein